MSLSTMPGPFLSRSCAAPQAQPDVVAPLRCGSLVGRARAGAKVRRVATRCAPSATTEGEAQREEREALREERAAHLAADAAALAARREEREAHLAAEASALAARREEREATLAERMALLSETKESREGKIAERLTTLAETKEIREEKFGDSTAASAQKGAESSAKAALNGETMAAASAVGVGATLLLALTMLALRGMPG